MVVDPGDEVFQIIERIEHHKLRVTAIWHTHAHIDHIGATKALYEICAQKNKEGGFSAPLIYLHEGDRWLYENVKIQASMLGMHPFDVSNDWVKITDGQNYDGFEKVKALHTPGHTPGSCCLQVSQSTQITAPRSFMSGIEREAPSVVLSGDTLFRQSIGRTDLWGGDMPTILKSIKSKLFGLNPESIVIPGHGPLSTIEFEREKNPFFS